MISTQVLFENVTMKSYMAIWRNKDSRPASAYHKFYIIWRAILRRLSKCYLIHHQGEPWHFGMITVVSMVKMISIRNDACHEPITSHQSNIL